MEPDESGDSKMVKVTDTNRETRRKMGFRGPAYRREFGADFIYVPRYSRRHVKALLAQRVTRRVRKQRARIVAQLAPLGLVPSGDIR